MTYDLNGRIVSPGLVDMHSHMGVDAWPDDLGANRDENEMTFPLTNYVRYVCVCVGVRRMCVRA